MKQREGTPNGDNTSQAQTLPRKPYQKPAFRHERIFETNALSCGKVQTTQYQCAHRRMNS